MFEERYNHNHDSKGRFAIGGGGGGRFSSFEDAKEALEKSGVAIDISKSGKFEDSAKENVVHLANLNDEYNTTMVSYTIGKSGDLSEGGSAYMHNGKTAIIVDPMSLKGSKAKDQMGLGDNSKYQTTYHEFAHSLSQSRQANTDTDKSFWKEVKKIQREYKKENDGGSNWAKVKISDYASKDVDEFMAEAFTKSKLHSNPNKYEKQVLDVVNKYYSKSAKRSVMIMKDFEHRSYTFELRAEENEAHVGVITGRPIVYNSRTDIGLFDEVIESGALNGADLRDVRFLVNHDVSKIPLARSRNNNANSTMQLMPDEQGLKIRVNLDVLNNTDARNLYSAIERGDITGMSFMFSVNDEEWSDLQTDHPTRHIKSIGSVVEVSAVTFPAYESTEISVRDKQALDNARSALDSARQSLDSDLELEKAKFEALLKVR